MPKQHRTLIKILLNPILRKIGWSIVSVFDGEKFQGYKLKPYPEFCQVTRTT